jgi:hypothetical protein
VRRLAAADYFEALFLDLTAECEKNDDEFQQRHKYHNSVHRPVFYFSETGFCLLSLRGDNPVGPNRLGQDTETSSISWAQLCMIHLKADCVRSGGAM